MLKIKTTTRIKEILKTIIVFVLIMMGLYAPELDPDFTAFVERLRYEMLNEIPRNAQQIQNDIDELHALLDAAQIHYSGTSNPFADMPVVVENFSKTSSDSVIAGLDLIRYELSPGEGEENDWTYVVDVLMQRVGCLPVHSDPVRRAPNTERRQRQNTTEEESAAAAAQAEQRAQEAAAATREIEEAARTALAEDIATEEANLKNEVEDNKRKTNILRITRNDLTSLRERRRQMDNPLTRAEENNFRSEINELEEIMGQSTLRVNTIKTRLYTLRTNTEIEVSNRISEARIAAETAAAQAEQAIQEAARQAETLRVEEARRAAEELAAARLADQRRLAAAAAQRRQAERLEQQEAEQRRQGEERTSAAQQGVTQPPNFRVGVPARSLPDYNAAELESRIRADDAERRIRVTQQNTLNTTRITGPTPGILELQTYARSSAAPDTYSTLYSMLRSGLQQFCYQQRNPGLNLLAAGQLTQGSAQRFRFSFPINGSTYTFTLSSEQIEELLREFQSRLPERQRELLPFLDVPGVHIEEVLEDSETEGTESGDSSSVTRRLLVPPRPTVVPIAPTLTNQPLPYNELTIPEEIMVKPTGPISGKQFFNYGIFDVLAKKQEAAKEKSAKSPKAGLLFDKIKEAFVYDDYSTGYNQKNMKKIDENQANTKPNKPIS